ncbi:MAG: hypothetical protein PHS74_12755 [Lachnospiraceae bacterium]|nr:hypothetical protein [Lachnospiraceae bacterium]
MKEKLEKFLKVYWKSIAGVMTLVVIATGILIFYNLEAKENPVDIAVDTSNEDIIQGEESQVTEIPKVEEIEESISKTPEDDIKKTTDTVEPTLKAEDTTKENVSTTKNTEINSEEKGTTVNTDLVKPSEKPDSNPETTVTETPTSAAKYVPISEGWKATDSAKGDITSAQKADLDALIETWRAGSLTDTELKEKIISYLGEQKIDYMEVSVTSKGYALFDEVPVIDLRDGGNLYSFVGCYSTGKQNPDGTNKTVCYNWSAFVF